jgi:1-acyl-sn-glycerol-3-phosphate acyltransferase
MTILRSAAFNLYFFTLTFVLALLVGVPLRLFAPARVIDLARFWARLVVGGLRLICGISYRVTGREHLPQGAMLIASQHQSAFDTLVWLMLVPRPSYVVKQELSRVPLFGPLLRAGGQILVDRSAGAAALRSLITQSNRAIAEGRQVVIFPEGTRTAPGTIAKLQPGVVALAAASHLPVIPVATDSGRHWGRRAFRKRAGTIHVAIQPPLPPDLPRPLLIERLERAWREGGQKLSHPCG